MKWTQSFVALLLRVAERVAEVEGVSMDDALLAFTPLYLRDRDQVAALFAELRLIEPGVVAVTDWRADPGEDETPQLGLLAAVARKE